LTKIAKSDEKLTAQTCYVINISAADCSILLKFGTEFDHVRPSVLQTFNIKGQGHIMAKCGKNLLNYQELGYGLFAFVQIWFRLRYATPYVLQTFRVKGQGQCDMSISSKNVISHKRIGWQSSNLVKIIPEWSALVHS